MTSRWSTVPTDSLSIVEGGRLARIRGCYDGCHGPGLEGQVFFAETGTATIHAPNLTQISAQYSDAELERAIRRGVRGDGRGVVVMPSYMFANLSDEDLGKIIAFIRAQPTTTGLPTLVRFGPIGRLGMALGQLEPAGVQLDATPPAKTPRSDPVEWGRYIALTTCSECHGSDLAGDPDMPSPPLLVGAGYELGDWRRLMREGKGLEDRDLGLMSEVAANRFTHLADAEVEALHAFLRAGAPLGSR
jgi:mono/diheme cytochrome c family protein